ncbi:MAG TPA: aminodeoxychorismate/anthranilate synthase component II [Aquifex aeolicus]|nr:aminodeoxychorismate/anthranilate synthase component II [Aquifex aeolicus]
MKILMIDNYDSFTYNLVQYLGFLGAEVIVKRNDEIELQEVKTIDPDAIVISPGPCTPKEAGISVPLIKSYYKDYPILGVCLGHQSIGYAFGGKIVNAKRLMHGKTSQIFHNGEGVFKNIPSPFTAVRYHSLAIDKGTLPQELKITAESDDGEIMGIQHMKYPVFGVQFHPESILSQYGMDVLKNFLEIAEGIKLARK